MDLVPTWLFDDRSTVGKVSCWLIQCTSNLAEIAFAGEKLSVGISLIRKHESTGKGVITFIDHHRFGNIAIRSNR